MLLNSKRKVQTQLFVSDPRIRLLLRPRVLVDVEKVSTATTILGQPIRSPICVAPTSLHGMAHRDGEKATAKGSILTLFIYENTFV